MQYFVVKYGYIGHLYNTSHAFQHGIGPPGKKYIYFLKLRSTWQRVRHFALAPFAFEIIWKAIKGTSFQFKSKCVFRF